MCVRQWTISRRKGSSVHRTYPSSLRTLGLRVHVRHARPQACGLPPPASSARNWQCGGVRRLRFVNSNMRFRPLSLPHVLTQDPAMKPTVRIVLALLALWAVPARAQETPPSIPAAAPPETAQELETKLLAAPNDRELLNKYMTARFRDLAEVVRTEPDKARADTRRVECDLGEDRSDRRRSQANAVDGQVGCGAEQAADRTAADFAGRAGTAVERKTGRSRDRLRCTAPRFRWTFSRRCRRRTRQMHNGSMREYLVQLREKVKENQEAIAALNQVDQRTDGA